jgi:hypothetical protein
MFYGTGATHDALLSLRNAKVGLDIRAGAEPHHMLDAGAVVPGSVEEDDLALSGELR